MEIGDHHPFWQVHAKRGGKIRINRLAHHARPGALELLRALIGLPHEGAHQIGGDGKADTVGAARAGHDPGVDPDQIAIHVNQRPARVAGVDRGVGLNEIAQPLSGGGTAARQPRHDAAADGLPHAKGVADGQRQFTHFDLIAVAQLQIGQAFGVLQLQDCQIAGLICQHHLRGVFAPVGCHHTDIGRHAHHGIVRHHDPVRRQDHARPQRVLHPWLRLGQATKEIVKERIVHERRATLFLHDLGVDVHHCGGCLFHQRCKAQRDLCLRLRHAGLGERLSGGDLSGQEQACCGQDGTKHDDSVCSCEQDMRTMPPFYKVGFTGEKQRLWPLPRKRKTPALFPERG